MSDYLSLPASWLLTVALHSGAWLGLAWLIDRLRTRAFAWREVMWRCAVFGGVLTASVQLLGTSSPIPTWHIALPKAGTSAPPLRANVAAAPTAQLTRLARSTTQYSTRRAQSTPAPGLQPGFPAGLRIDSGRANAWRFGVTLLVAAWLAGAIVAMINLLLALQGLRRMLCGSRPLQDQRTMQPLQELSFAYGMPAPQLLVHDALTSPLALSRRRIVVPAWALACLDPGRMNALLAHELMHIRRADPVWKLVFAIWQTLFWFLPLLGHARRRLDALAELACDAAAARHTGTPRQVAECLAACAERHRQPLSGGRLVAAMAVPDSSLLQRVERLLEGDSMQSKYSGFLARVVAACALVAGCVGLPAIAIVEAPLARAAHHLHVDADADSASSSVSISDGLGHHTMSVHVSDGKHAISARVEGKITFNDQDSDVATLSAGGSARFEETRGGSKRRLDIDEHDGKLVRAYFVDDKAQAYDASAQAWFAKLLPTVMRESGLNAQARVNRLYAAGGADRVLDEISLIDSGYVRGQYLQLLLDKGQLAPPQLDRALRLAGSMSSDYERGQALQHVFSTQQLSEVQQVTFLQQAKRFGSDYELAQLLIGIEPKLADSDAVRQAWLDAASRLSSSYERRRAFESILDSGRLNDKQLANLLASSAHIDSDYEHRVLLTEIARHMHDANALAPEYIQSVHSIGSDYEHGVALLALIHAGKLGAKGAQAVLDSAAQIGSDYECREVLVALAGVMPSDAATVAHYRQVASRLSTYNRGAAEQALVR